MHALDRHLLCTYCVPGPVAGSLSLAGKMVQKTGRYKVVASLLLTRLLTRLA